MRRPSPVTLRRLLYVVLAAVAGGSLYMALTLHDDTVTAGARSGVVRSVSPRPGSIQLRQTEIQVELDAAYGGELVVNGAVIPDDQLSVIQGLNRISYTPGPGREVETLPAGENCATVRYRPVTESGGQPGTYRWCFSVQ